MVFDISFSDSESEKNELDVFFTVYCLLWSITDCFVQTSVETLDISIEVLLTKLPKSKRSKIFAL